MAGKIKVRPKRKIKVRPKQKIIVKPRNTSEQKRDKNGRFK